MTESGSVNAHGNSDVVTLVVTMAVKPEYEQEFLDFASHTVISEGNDFCLAVLEGSGLVWRV